MVTLVWRSTCSNRFIAVIYAKAMHSFTCAGIALFRSGHFFENTAIARNLYSVTCINTAPMPISELSDITNKSKES